MALENQLEQFGISHYRIIDENKIIVYQNIDWSNKGFTEIPIKLEEVFGTFDLKNNQLTNLNNCPSKITGVTGHLDLSGNNLTSLKGSPIKVNMLILNGNKNLSSLDYVSSDAKVIANVNTNINSDDIAIYNYIRKYFTWCQHTTLADNVKLLLRFKKESLEFLKDEITPQRYNELRGAIQGTNLGII